MKPIKALICIMIVCLACPAAGWAQQNGSVETAPSDISEEDMDIIANLDLLDDLELLEEDLELFEDFENIEQSKTTGETDE